MLTALLHQALYFDRYQKLLAPGSDPLRDTRLRDYLNNEMGGPPPSVEPIPSPIAAAVITVETVAAVEGDVTLKEEPPFRMNSL